jgi:diguanylate cyclase (GGDEF)-like protein
VELPPDTQISRWLQVKTRRLNVDRPSVDWVRFQLGPRDQRIAARTAAWIYLVSAVVIMVSNLFVPLSLSARLTAIVLTVPLLIFGGLLAWPRFRYKAALLLVTPLFGAMVVAALNLATDDASAGAQVGFCLPVLFGASQLRFLGAGLAAAAAIGADVLVVWQLRPNSGGVIDVVNLSLVLLLMTGLLVQAGQRQDRLVALLESQASLDPLTGLVTRRVLDEAVRRALAAPAMDAGTALILVDVDHFKSINDTYGHPVGDDALVHIAKVLGRHSRPDTVISRLGGDEIAVLLLGCSEAAARNRAHDFLHTMRDNPLRLAGGDELTMSISLGVAHAPWGESQLRELYAAADASLYQAKHSGRGRVGAAALAQPMFISPATGDDRIDHR